MGFKKFGVDHHEGDRVANNDAPREQKLQWTVKGIDSDVRELSRRAARKAGMRVGSWVEISLREAALVALSESEQSSQSGHAVVERLGNLEEIVAKASEEQARVLTELQKDLHILQRGILERVLSDR